MHIHSKIESKQWHLMSIFEFHRFSLQLLRIQSKNFMTLSLDSFHFISSIRAITVEFAKTQKCLMQWNPKAKAEGEQNLNQLNAFTVH